MSQRDPPKPLDDSLYELEDDEHEFLSSQTGIQDKAELKEHVLTVQREIYKVHPYYCIRTFGFARLKMCRYPAYATLLKLGRERPGALFLDLGCCVGNDVRKAVYDGFPVKQVLACDLHPEFWDMGHALFKTTPDTFPVPFIQADIFDTACLRPSPVPLAPPADPLPDLVILKELTPLLGRLSAIHTSSFFHLFSEDQQLKLAKLIAPLLRPEPGSIIFGGHVGLPSKGFQGGKNTHGIPMFCHSPESWKEMWGEVFPNGEVKVDAYVKEFTKMHPNIGEDFGYFLIWSVTRL